jgi:hypothetical protein
MVAFTVLIAPAEAGRAVKATYRALPGSFRDAVPDSWEEGAGRTIDATARVLSFGDPDRLVDLDLRLEYSSVPPNGWGPDHRLMLAWSDLGPGISYEINVGHSPAGGGVDVAAQRYFVPNATISLPGDGDWYARVRPITGTEEGRMTVFGPFRIDSTPPPAPVLRPIDPPPGYSFPVFWNPVDDTSGIQGYQVERLVGVTNFQPVGVTRELRWQEDQLGNGNYRYQVRSINGAGLLSPPSNMQQVSVKAPMNNPGVGNFRYGIHANYTSFLKLWDISNPNLYATKNQVPAGIASEYLAGGWGFDIQNQTLIQKTREIVGAEQNTMRIAEKLFVWLYDWADYDTCKISPKPAGCPASSGDDSDLQPASVTFDRRKGICGDLATLYITMLRIAGVPARPVHGYLDNSGATGGVRIGDFHVWVEAWVGMSLQSADSTDTRSDWMTIDVSGITGPFEPEYLMVYFGIFNPEYLALGLDADYSQSSWNSWAQFGWTKRAGDTRSPTFLANGAPVALASKSMNMFFDSNSKRRVLVEEGKDPPRGYTQFFPNIQVESKKRIDYGVNLSGDVPLNATIRLRYPQADAYANVLPWQSVIFTVYQRSETVDKDPVTGRVYRMDGEGFVVWEDDFKK